MFALMLRKFEDEIRSSWEKIAVIRECSQMVSTLDRLHYGEHLIKKYKHIFKWESEMKVHKKKSDELSISLRVEGNNLHNQGKYVEAVICYNKSICFAASTVNISIGYSNRSASLFEMGRFQDCQENIRLAREQEVLQENLKRKLDNREAKCRDAQKRGQEFLQSKKVKKEFGLAYREHPQVPFIVNRLEIKLERHKAWICAKEYIEPGAIIMQHEVSNFVLFPEGYYTQCHFCLKTCGHLIPCPDCTCTMFCNEYCMNRANEEFHKWECPIIDLLSSFDNYVRLSFRILLQMLNIFGDFSEFDKYWKDLTEKHVAWFTIDRTKFNRIEQLRALHSSEGEYNEIRDPLRFPLMAAFFKAEIMKHSDLKGIFQTDEQKDLFGEIILHHIMLLFKKRLIGRVGRDSFNFKRMYAASYSLIEEIKDSDSPNVIRKWKENQMTWFACRPIKKGEFLRMKMRCEAGNELDQLGRQLMFLNMLDALTNSGPAFPFF